MNFFRMEGMKMVLYELLTSTNIFSLVGRGMIEVSAFDINFRVNLFGHKF